MWEQVSAATVVCATARVNVAMAINLFEHQRDAVNKLESGKILVGGVGSGKSRTALYWYYSKQCEGKIKTNGVGGYSPMRKPKDLYIITTARKRDELDWLVELAPFRLTTSREENENGVGVFVDSWNNIAKYAHIKDAVFIFDEQRVIGNGVWVKSFLKITKNNQWVLLSATPADTWTDYIPVFIANGWYKNRTEFFRRHVVFNHFSKFPKIDHYIEVRRLANLRDTVIINMRYKKRTISHDKYINVPFDKELQNTVLIKRWNVYEQRPVKDVSEMCRLLRRVVNSDPRRVDIVGQLLEENPRAIIFYNFNYERELLLELGKKLDIPIAEWSGHKHQPIPDTDNWMYIVQYTAGAEGWNCIDTNVIIFFSQNYSYKATIQAAGRIDRLNTPFTDLYYYYLISNSVIDLAIQKAFNNKKNFNEHRFMAA